MNEEQVVPELSDGVPAIADGVTGPEGTGQLEQPINPALPDVVGEIGPEGPPVVNPALPDGSW